MERKAEKQAGGKMKHSHQKLKLLYLMKILLEKTDDEHSMTVPEMIEELAKLGITAERRSIYDDLEYIKLFGLDLCTRKSKTHDYFIGSRTFELPELKLLVDSVQSSKFITYKKSMELISKIEKLTSIHNAKMLHRQVYVTNRVKTVNEQIYYNVDKIHEAIAANKQIIFKYFDLNVDKKKVYRKNGDFYTESPVALSWNDENYYLITYKPKYGDYAHYRVDKMENIEIIENDRVLSEEPFDLSEYSKTTFAMFSGEETEVTILFENELVGVIYDRFGTNVRIVKADESHFICTVNVAISPHFLSWIISFGDRAKILSPEYVIDDMYELIIKAKSMYDK